MARMAEGSREMWLQMSFRIWGNRWPVREHRLRNSNIFAKYSPEAICLKPKGLSAFFDAVIDGTL
jgi:hypothetical protein